VIKLDTSGNQAKLTYIAIGSNLGNRKNNIEKAKFKLFQNDLKVSQTSSFYETLSWPNPSNPKFLNIVLAIFTNLKPSRILKICKKIELELGRKNSPKNSPRECDIDIIDYNNKAFNKGIVLPHPRMHERNFVLIPLFEIDKDWRHPILKHNIKSLISSLSNEEIRSIKKI
jgi:2-amino-4-hydroxy-6-hydroxymethyldihydropteridine diphosphokinase